MSITHTRITIPPLCYGERERNQCVCVRVYRELVKLLLTGERVTIDRLYRELVKLQRIGDIVRR